MNVDMWENDGVPIKILRNAVGHDVKCETTTGDLYKGKLVGMEDNMNVQLETAVRTTRSGVSTLIDRVLIRGSRVKFVIMPDFLRKKGIFRGRGDGAAGERRGRGRGVSCPAHRPGSSSGYNAIQSENPRHYSSPSQPSTSGLSSQQYLPASGGAYSPFYYQYVTSSPASSTVTYPGSDWSPAGQPSVYEAYPGMQYSPLTPRTQHHSAEDYSGGYKSTSTYEP